MTNNYVQAPWLNFERKKITVWTPLLHIQEKQTKNQFFFGNTDVNMISDISLTFLYWPRHSKDITESRDYSN